MTFINEKHFTKVSFDEFCTALSQRINKSKNELFPEANLVNDVGITSIDIVKIVMLIRQKFGIKISITQAGKIKTVQDAYELLMLYNRND